MGDHGAERRGTPFRHGISRRGVLTGGLAATAATMLGACSNEGSATTSSGGDTSGGASGKAALPDYVERTDIPKPDLPGTDKATAAYLKFPEPFNGYDGKPLSGETVKNFTIIYAPPSPAVDKNTWWQAVNKAVGGTIEAVQVPAGSWDTKTAATIAGGSIPDYMLFTGAVKSFPKVLDALFEDLTPHLSGKNVRKYKNLANIPTTVWKNSMVNGKIFGIPIARSLTNSSFQYRADYLKAAGLDVPKSLDDLTEVAKGVTNPDKNRFAFDCGTTGNPFLYTFFLQVYGCQNWWAVDDSGNFTHYVENPAGVEALSQMQKYYKAGYFYPTPPQNGNSKGKLHIQTGKSFLYADGIGGIVLNYEKARQIDKNVDIQCMVPPAHDGGDQVYWLSSGLFGKFTALSKSSKVPVETRLKLCDWAAAPMGSEQYNLNQYGVEGTDYTMKDGAVTVTDKGTAEAGKNVWQYLAGPPYVFLGPIEQAVKAEHSFSKAAAEVGISNAAEGLYSETRSAGVGSLNKIIHDAVTQIVMGRKPIDSWKDMVTQWKNQGGDKIRAELEKSYAEGH